MAQLVGASSLRLKGHGFNSWSGLYEQATMFLTHIDAALSLFFKKDFIYLFIERGEGMEKERGRNIHWLPLTSPAGDLIYNPGMCPD